MDVAGTLINAGVVAGVGLILGWLGKGRFEAVERRLDRVETELGSSIDGLRSEMTSAIGALRLETTSAIEGLRVETNGLRSDLTAVALAVGARPRAQNG
jgi:hypothetical protein